MTPPQTQTPPESLGKRAWTDDEIALLKSAYENATCADDLGLDDLAAKFGRHKSNVSRKARALGLTDKSRRYKKVRKDRRKFKGDTNALREHLSASIKDRIAKNGHPRGMAGKKHTAQARQAISEKSKEFWAGLTQAQRDDLQNKMHRSIRENGPPKVARGTWKADWRTIGGKRNYYRSRWEANYARWLEYLKQCGDIIDWEHEPKVFWFEKILRGVRSYKPDFCVQDRDGEITWHEVKGWMDARSVTALKRFAKYYPDEILILVRERQIRALGKNHAAFIDGWEI
jgi:hypothetical protein